MLMDVEYWFKNYFENFLQKNKNAIKSFDGFLYIYIFFYESGVKLS